MVYIIFIAIVSPILALLFILKGDSRIIFAFTIIGMMIALVSHEFNSVLNNLLSNISTFQFTTYITPVCEEILKTIPIIFFAIVISDKAQIILPISMSVGIGFAVLENSYMIAVNVSSINIIWAIIRGFATGLMHGVTAEVTGSGMIFINKKRKLFYTGIFGLLSLAIMYHSIYNMLIQSKYQYVAYLLPIITYLFIIVFIYREKINNLILRKS